MTSPLRQTLTVSELAATLGIGIRQAYALVRDGRVYSFRVGRRICIPRSAVERLLAGEGRRDER